MAEHDADKDSTVVKAKEKGNSAHERNSSTVSTDTAASFGVDTAQTIANIESLVRDHEPDQNFPQDIIKRAREFLAARNDGAVVDEEAARLLVHDFEKQRKLALNDSAYPEVRAVVDPTDDPTTPVGTFRVFVLGTFFTVFGTAISQFFSLRMPNIGISTYMVQLLSMPFGVAMAKWLPSREFGDGRWWSFSLNPGPFNYKEHLLIAMMANVSFGGWATGAYMVRMVQVMHLDRFFGEKVLSQSMSWQIMTLLATQLMGYGCAGMARRFLVYPAAMIWQKPLSNIALTKALCMDKKNGIAARGAVNGWTISRYRFFMVTFFAMFVWYWVPNYLFEATALFNWPTWISPTSVKLALVAGSTCGLGLNPLPTLDWNIATYLSDPIITPLFTLLNFAAGMAFVGFVVAPLMYFNNVWQAGYLPINGNKIYDNSAQFYDIHRILNHDMTINEAAYHGYSVPRLTTTQILNYAGLFALYTAVPVHIFLWHRHDIASGLKSVWSRRARSDDFKDVHNRLISEYAECPHWWYLAVLAVSFTLACISVSVWPTGMPIWGIVLALTFTTIIQIPVGMLLAITNLEVPTSILSMLVGGYVLEGRAIPNMLFKIFSFMSTSQSLNFVSDLKLAHYAKIPPRWAFAAQVYATVLAGFVALSVNHWVLRNVDDVCDLRQKDRFSCPGTHSYFLSTVLWGVVGPRRLFGPGAPYSPVTYVAPLGLVLPVVVFYARRRWPGSLWRSVNIPILFAGPLGWSPYNWSYMQGSVFLGLFFNHFVKRRYRGWWERYAYVLTSSFTAAIGISGLVIFFCLERWNIRLNWWGNDIQNQGVDKSIWGEGTRCANLVLEPGQTFDAGF